MEVSNSRWVAVLVIAVSVLITALLSILIPIINYGGNPNLDAAWVSTQWGTPTHAPTQDLSPLVTIQPESGASQITPSATLNPNCTYAALYWVYHLESWPEQIVQGSLFYTRRQVQQLIQATNVDVSSVLLIQYLAAYLNFSHGADLSDIVDVMSDASDWLSKHPQGSTLLESEAQEAFQMAEVLEEFNTGVIGPGRCPDDLIAVAGQIALIPVPVLSITPSTILMTSVPTLAPSATPSITPTRITVRATVVPPTATAKPKEDNNNPKPTKVPQPTQPPPDPTEPPPDPTEPPPPSP